MRPVLDDFVNSALEKAGNFDRILDNYKKLMSLNDEENRSACLYYDDSELELQRDPVTFIGDRLYRKSTVTDSVFQKLKTVGKTLWDLHKKINVGQNQFTQMIYGWEFYSQGLSQEIERRNMPEDVYNVLFKSPEEKIMDAFRNCNIVISDSDSVKRLNQYLVASLS